jgi:hypothetical protein
MWRIYVGGLFTGMGIGIFLMWLAAWMIAPETARTQLLPFGFFPLVFVLAGETLRIRGRKPETRD